MWGDLRSSLGGVGDPRRAGRIVTSSDDGTAMLWDVDYHTTVDYLCSILLRDFTDDERAQYGIKDNTPTCP